MLAKKFFVKCLSSFDQNTAQSVWQCPFQSSLHEVCFFRAKLVFKGLRYPQVFVAGLEDLIEPWI